MSKKIIKIAGVQQHTTFSRSTVYRLAAEGKFPKPIKLSERSSGWIEEDVLKYLDDRINGSEL